MKKTEGGSAKNTKKAGRGGESGRKIWEDHRANRAGRATKLKIII